LFVTHDLGVVSKVCQSLTVLYGGLVVEDTAVRDFFPAPAHPYARALLAATPKYTDPGSSLVPVPRQVLEGVQAQVDAADRGWRHG
jgi:peptide/nickel transport system ATP-binding protein